MKTILCYGDSNTWGWMAEKYHLETDYKERYSRDIRWPGRLQKLLGDQFYVIEEGLNGRTTNVDSPDPPDRNGKNYLLPCLYSHAPLDLVILMLGGNDLKDIYHRSARDIANGIEELIQMIQKTTYGSDMQSAPKILLIGYPVLCSDDAIKYCNDLEYVENTRKKALQFDSLFSAVAQRHGCFYFNLAPYAQFSEIDGVHFNEKGHAICADLLAIEIQKIL